MLPAALAWGQTPGQPAQDQLRQQQELLRQQERALREQQEARPDVRLDRESQVQSARLPADEAPCFPIQRIVLEGEHADDFD